MLSKASFALQGVCIEPPNDSSKTTAESGGTHVTLSRCFNDTSPFWNEGLSSVRDSNTELSLSRRFISPFLESPTWIHGAAPHSSLTGWLTEENQEEYVLRGKYDTGEKIETYRQKLP